MVFRAQMFFEFIEFSKEDWLGSNFQLVKNAGDIKSTSVQELSLRLLYSTY
jgi:hypothetical protein